MFTQMFTLEMMPEMAFSSYQQCFMEIDMNYKNDLKGKCTSLSPADALNRMVC